MDVLKTLLTSLTIFYGVTFNEKDPFLVKFFGSIFVLISATVEVYGCYITFINNPITIFGGYLTESIGIVSFELIIIVKRDEIVRFISSNVNLLSPFQYKVTVSCVIISLFIFFIESVFNSIVYYNFLITTDSPFSYESYVLMQSVLFKPYDQWTISGAIIYALIYFLIHIKHDRLLNELLKEEKSLSYVVIYKLLLQFESDYKYFDSLVCLLPAFWLIHLFLGMNNIVISILSFDYKVQVVTFVVKNFVSWTLVYILIIFCHSEICEKVKTFKYKIVLSRQIDEPKGLTLQLLDQITSINVTAGYLVKLNSGLLLPYIGSLCTYTFLFSDKFKEIS